MVQVVPADPGWGDVFANIGGGLVSGYQNRADEKAIQNAVVGLGENPSPQDVLKAVTGTKTHNPAAKQNFFKNYLGAAELEQTTSKAALQRERDLASDEIKKKTAQAKETRDKSADERAKSKLDIDQAKLKLDQDKFEFEKNKPPKTEKAPPKSEFDKVLERKNAEDFVHLQEEIPVLKDTLKAIDDVEGIAKGRGLTGVVTGALGLGSSGKELEAKSFPLIQPIVKMFNPSGPIAQRKLELIQSKYQIKATDPPWVVKGKIAALRSFAKQALARAEGRMAIYSKYNGNPPPQEVTQYDKESELMGDAMLDHSLVEEEPVFYEASTGRKLKNLPKDKIEQLEKDNVITRVKPQSR